ncbi:MAG: hypothetical protein ACTSSF_06685 [Candidatus Heimdallarchaeaceae archaeon]
MEDKTGELLRESQKTRKAPPPFKLDIRYLINKLFFPNLKRRGKREYISSLIIRGSTYLAFSYALSILFGTLLYFLTDLYYITSFIWSPEEILVLPFMFNFLETPTKIGGDAFTIVTNYVVTIILPFFISGIISGILWKKEAQDLILVSSTITFVIFILLHLSQVLLFTSFSTVFFALTTSFLYYGFVFAYALSFLIFSALAGNIGVKLGYLFSNIRFQRKGAKIAYSHLLLPKMPITVKTIFDLSKPVQSTDRQSSSITLVYLNYRVNTILKRVQTKSCTYFEGGRCAYLGYLTARHKYQICLTQYWPLCRVYAFLNQSKLIFKEANVGENNV